ncbi:MAG: hypothetical protein UU48_C0015G0017 [Candidatus Uhrbacteria bacterium GW2011_GWF2_41_16]|jgi:uncharacterized protein (DUF362 family)|uniref:DUF362 domain-containing protein n=2 Tax=Candidatus Uhriibacteriota TaxID=1752732 RepID=A0A0G0VCQ1_9BACT|nr:MAG: hypothetical protein UU35_C0016G0017 [Candidatus Uhrbacteria bacterium GW2011_GWC2_41_11]KKR97441.1 MAG: hypothetical protein UU48_C0015G0017 [Candidatus Uhrbacteria bacterium GW2011_GWF2_41_16]HBP00100.1 hypothetical protein [Candidatus Uhrbacteria bacterium]
MSSVAFVHGEKRRQNMMRVFELILPSVREKLRSVSSVFIKPNLVHHLNQFASSHVDAVRGLLDVLRKETQVPVMIGDASYYGTKAAFRNFGYERLVEEYPNIQLIDLNDGETIPGFYVKIDGSHGEMGYAKQIADAGFTINLACLKTHRDTGVSFSIKNWTLGTWVVPPTPGAYGPHWSRAVFLHHQHPWAFHQTIARLLEQHAPDLSFIDGFFGMEGEGPTHGTLVEMGVALAGTDAIAVDLAACQLTGFDSNEIGYLVFAREKRYSEGRSFDVSFIGDQDFFSYKKVFQKPLGWERKKEIWKEK